MLRNFLKIFISVAWVIILPLFYVDTASNITLPWEGLTEWLHQVKGVPPLYIIAVALYMFPNILAAFMFLFPMLRRWIENSDWHIIRLLIWWSQVDILLSLIY